jgi:hypothetical protein
MEILKVETYIKQERVGILSFNLATADRERFKSTTHPFFPSILWPVL